MTLTFPTENVGPLPVEDPNGVYPTLDGIGPVTPPDVPPGFDLITILSESMVVRPQWRDLAAAASRIVYEYVERTRLALQMAREPFVLARTLKIATLRMIGLDWSSTLLSDADLDRTLIEAAEFFQTNGPQHFARYMGYALGVPMQLIPLWTEDYAAFTPGPSLSANGLIVDPGGTSYPTSHVDLLYELFSTRGGEIDAYQDDIRLLFDDVAPIHLVLNWIVAQISLSVHTLYLSILLFDDGDDTVLVDDPASGVVTVAGAPLIAAGTPWSSLVVGGGRGIPDPTPTDTTVGDIVYSTTDVESYPIVGGTRFYVTLGSDVGGWPIATVGIYANGVLAAYAPFPIIGTKRVDNLPAVRGDVRHLVVDVPHA